MDRRPFTEIGVCLLISIISLVFLVQALRLPPGTFEPLGSGPAPTYTALVVLVCCLAVIVRALLHLRREADVAGALRDEVSGANPGGGVLMMGLTVVYVAVLQLELAGFGILTTCYLTLLILAMDGFRRRTILPALIVALVASFGAEYLFTRVFVVDLPV